MALLHVDFLSKVLELSMTMNVIMPEHTDPPAGGWPTLYLLHGLTDNHTGWQRRSSIERYVEGLPLCVVIPTVHRGFYTDIKDGGQYWTFISEEVPAVCERMFPLCRQREGRFAAGLSMGGYGAFKLGLRRPDRYAAVASLSGALDVVSEYATGNFEPLFRASFSSQQDLKGSENDLMAVAQRLVDSGTAPLPRFYIACGVDDPLYGYNQNFLNAFKAPLNITYEEGPGGHSWDFWDAYIQKALVWMGFAKNA